MAHPVSYLGNIFLLLMSSLHMNLQACFVKGLKLTKCTLELQELFMHCLHMSLQGFLCEKCNILTVIATKRLLIDIFVVDSADMLLHGTLPGKLLRADVAFEVLGLIMNCPCVNFQAALLGSFKGTLAALELSYSFVD